MSHSSGDENSSFHFSGDSLQNSDDGENRLAAQKETYTTPPVMPPDPLPGTDGTAARIPPRARLAASYKPGSTLFVHYDEDGTPQVRYANASWHHLTSLGDKVALPLVVCCFVSVIIMLVAFGVGTSLLSNPGKLTYGKQACDISDTAGAFTAQEISHIEAAAQRYYDMTGIALTVLTTDQDTLNRSTTAESLADYAREIYNQRFANMGYTTMGKNDENHWLIVFEIIDRDTNTWEFASAQGTNTSDWLTEERETRFNDDLTSALNDTGRAYGEAFARALNALTDRGNNLTGRQKKAAAVSLAVGVVFLGVFLWCLAIFLRPTVNRRHLRGWHEVNVARLPVPDGGPRLATCPRCGFHYVLGERFCPTCGEAGVESVELDAEGS